MICSDARAAVVEETFIVLLSFEQEDIATLVTSGAEAVAEAAEKLGGQTETEGFDIRDFWLTTGDYQVVVILRAPPGADAQRIAAMFDDLDVEVNDVISLTNSGADVADIVDAFNGHTKMR